MHKTFYILAMTNECIHQRNTIIVLYVLKDNYALDYTVNNNHYQKHYKSQQWLLVYCLNVHIPEVSVLADSTA